MKAFEELDHNELISLTEEEIQFYIDRECAVAGVPLLPPSPPDPVEIPQIEKSITHYLVGGLRLTSRDEAEQLAALIGKLKTRRSLKYLGSRYSYKDPTHDAADPNEYTIGQERVFSMSEAAAQKAENDKLGQRKASYDTAKKEYDAALTGRMNVGEGIRRIVDDAHSLQYRRQRLLAELERYRPLADGNEHIALRFLARAHREAPDVLAHLFVGVELDPPMAANPAEEEVIL